MSLKSLIRKPFRYAFWNASLVIIGINLAVFLLSVLNPYVNYYLSMNPLLVLYKGMVWQVFTYQFAHADISHLFFNMLGVFMFGMSVERRVGSKEFLLLYLLSGTISGVLSLALYVATGTTGVFLLGASGSLFALMLAYAVLYPSSIILIWGVIPVPAPLLVLGYAIIEVFYLITATNQGVAHGTHLFGFAAGWAYFLVRFGINPIKVWTKRQ
ncbi:MAG TPA: rhomboid family intramembrane serine protease [Treponemataceae bacterium]|nr:rhomboid family intramembrane serine protease [Treponemataceae bacterium]